MLNWGLSLVFSGLLARAIARRSDLEVDYRAIGAAAYMGLGAVWALGLSSSAAQLQATAESLPPELLEDHRRARLRRHHPDLAVADHGGDPDRADRGDLVVLGPQGKAIRTAEDMEVDLDDTVDPPPAAHPPGGVARALARSCPIFVGLLSLLWLVYQFIDNPFLTVISSLDTYLLVFVVLGLVLHGTPRGFLDATIKAVPTTAGVLVQYPLYAAMAAVLTRATGRGGLTVSEHLADLFTDLGGGGGFAVVIAIYTAILGILVPSGGGKWLVEAPYVMQSATDVQHEPRLDGPDLQRRRGPAQPGQPVLHAAAAGRPGAAGPRPDRVHLPAVHLPPAGGAAAALAARA